MDELKVRADELQAVNSNLKRELARVYRELERHKQEPQQKMFSGFAQ
jgi:hypothetical protein